MANRSGKKGDRMRKIEYLLLSHPEGFNQAELAERLGVHRSTITRYIPSLPGYIYIDDMDHNRWKMDTRAEMVRVNYSVNEAISVYLALRLMTDEMRVKNPHAMLALRKLGVGLESLTPGISALMIRAAEEMRPENPHEKSRQLIENLEKLTLAWVRFNKVKVQYMVEAKPAETLVFCPLSFEPSVSEHTVLVHGWQDGQRTPITLDMSHVGWVEMLEECFDLSEEEFMVFRKPRRSGGED